LIEEKYSSRPKLSDHKEEPDGQGGGTQRRHCTIDVIERQRASETTLRTDTTVSRVWPKGRAQPRRRHDACVPPDGAEGQGAPTPHVGVAAVVERHSTTESNPNPTGSDIPEGWASREHAHRPPAPNMPQSSDKNPRPEPSNRQEEATTTTATAHLTSKKRPHPWPPSASPWGTSIQTEAASAAIDGKIEGLSTLPRRLPGWGARHHHGRHLRSHGTRHPQRSARCRMMAE
jgi:hypothetical protein